MKINYNNTLQEFASTKSCVDIIRQTVESCYGIVGMASANGISLFSQLVPGFLNKKGIEILFSPNGLKINIFIVVEYGTNFKIVCKNLCDVLKYNLKEKCGVTTEMINIHIKGIRKRRF